MNVEKALSALRENGFDARWFATAAEAGDALCAELKGKTVGIGGSVTVEQMGLGDRLSRENTVFWHWRQPAAEARKNAMAAEVYLLSANAVSETGALVNIDGTGNRVSALSFGPGEVFVIAGVNKRVEGGEEAAIERIKTQACGKNARRLGLNTPCARLNRCVGEGGCASPQRMCNVVQKIERAPGGRAFHVVLIDEALGY